MSTDTPLPKVKIQGVSLYPDDWALAKRAARQMGSRSISAGLRAIIQFYRQYHEQPQPVPPTT